jgi:hypothetical protein
MRWRDAGGCMTAARPAVITQPCPVSGVEPAYPPMGVPPGYTQHTGHGRGRVALDPDPPHQQPSAQCLKDAQSGAEQATTMSN